MALYTLFASYGPVLDVVALKGKMRGQAHVVFRDIAASTQAMRSLQGFDLCGKQMKIQFGKGRSNVFARLEGVYRPPTEPATATAQTEVQKSIFSAPIGGTATVETLSSTNGAPSAPVGLPPKPGSVPAAVAATGSEGEPKGVKRRRDDEEEEEEEKKDANGKDEVEDDEDDDDVSMEASSDEEN
jgi:U2 small nuclear ribonucleoprotein B''